MNQQEWFSHLTDLGCICFAIEMYGKLPAQEMACKLLESPAYPAQIHHDRHDTGMGEKSDWEETIPLCYRHHQSGWELPSVHFGNKGKTLKNFVEKYGTVVELNNYCQEIVAWKLRIEAW